jgi:transposase
MSLKRRQFTKEFKIQVLREIEAGKSAAGKSAAQAAREHQVHTPMIYKWQKQQEQHGEQAFPGNGHTTETAEAKIANWSG